MGLKSRIKVNEKPLPAPKVPPIPTLSSVKAATTGTRKAPVAAFGTPFRITPAIGYRGPKIPGYVFVAAWRVEQSDDQILNFLDVSDKIGNVQKLFHGTPATNIEAICANGLRPGRHGCMFGAGIYMGGPLKAIGYAHAGYGRRGRRYDYAEAAHYLLAVDAALGKIKPCMAAEAHNKEKLTDQGFHSVGGFANMTASYGNTTLRHNEYVVYTPDQVVVNFILEYQRDLNDVPTWGPSARILPPTPPTSGSCGILKEKDVVLGPSQRAFKDILSLQSCGSTSYTNVKVVRIDNGQAINSGIWVCKGCVEALKLRVGSKVEIKTGYRSEKATVRIVG